MQLNPGHILLITERAWTHTPVTINGDEFFVGCNLRSSWSEQKFAQEKIEIYRQS